MTAGESKEANDVNEVNRENIAISDRLGFYRNKLRQ